jgi:3-hydroxyacyl-[acyl-carrier-protein] dehydratase
LLDYIYDAVPEEKARGIKRFSYNEWLFPAHFDDDQNVPDFIQVESLVQIFFMIFLSQNELKGKKTNFIGVNNDKFKRNLGYAQR